MASEIRTQIPADRGNRRLKRLDRVIGIPVVFVLGAARRARWWRQLPDDWHSVGLVKTAAIGDVVLLSGIVHDLRAARPDARIVLFATETNAGFGRLLDGIDEIVVLPVRAIGRAVRRVREQHLDVCVDFGAWPRFDALVTILSGARWTVGRRTPRQWRHFGFDTRIDHSSNQHELENFRSLMRPLGIESTSEPRIQIPPGPRPVDAPYAVLHLWPGGANSRERSWPEDRWKGLAAALNSRGLTVVLTGASGDANPTARLIETWNAVGLRATSVAGASPSDCARWLGGAAGVVTVNTGVMHLAAALGVPTVGLNGPTSRLRWGPIGQKAQCVSSPAVPDGYLDLGFERDDRYADCMHGISVASVLQAWDAVTSTSPGVAEHDSEPKGHRPEQPV